MKKGIIKVKHNILTGIIVLDINTYPSIPSRNSIPPKKQRVPPVNKTLLTNKKVQGATSKLKEMLKGMLNSNITSTIEQK